MSYLTAKEFSEKWGISERRIIKLCQDERIQGAVKNGRIWNIPENTMKPTDQRSNIASYMDTQKRVMVVNFNTKIGDYLIPLLKKQGFLVEGICEEGSKFSTKKYKDLKIYKTDFEDRKKLEKLLREIGKYYDGLIFIEKDKLSSQLLKNKEWFIIKLAPKMDFESSVVLVNYKESAKAKLETKLAKKSKERIGFRINSLNIELPRQSKIWVNYEEIAEDVCTLFTEFKNTTGISMITDGGCISFDKQGRTENLETGLFYRIIHQYFKKLDKKSHLWCVSTMLEDEWTEEHLEMSFRGLNLEAANRGIKIERIFLFRKCDIPKFKRNKALKIYKQSHIHTMFVDYHEILEKEPELLKVVADGWDGIDENTLIVDLPEGCLQRGYVTQNKKEVKKAKECFERLKSYAQDLKEVLK